MSTQDKKGVFDRIALGCITHLETFDECKNILTHFNDPASGADFSIWEKRNEPYKLPTDLRRFYSIFNGFHISWQVEIAGKLETIGEMHLNKLDQVTKTSCDDFTVADEVYSESKCNPKPKRCVFFSIDSTSCSVGEVVLLYHIDSSQQSNGENAENNEPEVWLIETKENNTKKLHYIAKTISDYLRLLVCHLGIFGWQSLFTEDGLNLNTQHWMSLFCKERLIIDRAYLFDLQKDIQAKTQQIVNKE